MWTLRPSSLSHTPASSHKCLRRRNARSSASWQLRQTPENAPLAFHYGRSLQHRETLSAAFRPAHRNNPAASTDKSRVHFSDIAEYLCDILSSTSGLHTPGVLENEETDYSVFASRTRQLRLERIS